MIRCVAQAFLLAITFIPLLCGDAFSQPAASPEGGSELAEAVWRRRPHCPEDCPNTIAPPLGWWFIKASGKPPTQELQVRLRLDDPGAGDQQQQFDTVMEAIARWNAPEGWDTPFRFRAVMGDPAGAVAAADNINTILARRSGEDDAFCQEGSLGYSILQMVWPIYSELSALIAQELPNIHDVLDVDLVLCDRANWFASGHGEQDWPEGDQFDLLSILIHELGHNLGLDHSNFNGNPADCDGVLSTGSAMDTCVLGRGRVRRWVHRNDATGLGAIYGRDPDLDRVRQSRDNCRHVANPDQLDSDGDRVGDACDPDFFLNQPGWMDLIKKRSPREWQWIPRPFSDPPALPR